MALAFLELASLSWLPAVEESLSLQRVWNRLLLANLVLFVN